MASQFTKYNKVTCCLYLCVEGSGELSICNRDGKVNVYIPSLFDFSPRVPRLLTSGFLETYLFTYLLFKA